MKAASGVGGTLSTRVLGVLLAVTTVFLAPTIASAVPPLAAAPAADTPAPASDDPITWAVEPSNASGPDGRRWMEIDLNAGQRLTEHLAVRNLGSVPATFSLVAADGYLTKDGSFTILPSTQTSKDAGTWISIKDSVRVEPGATAVVPFEILVPGDATPGDHPAGIAATLTTGAGAATLEGRVGFRVMMRVRGEIAPKLAITGLKVDYETSANPFSLGKAHVSYTMTNTGNARLGAQATVSSRTKWGPAAIEKADAFTELMPGDSRSQSVTVDRVWTFGSVTTAVTVKALPVKGLTSELPGDVSAKNSTWISPVPQLIVVGALALLALIAVLRWRRRRAAQDSLAPFRGRTTSMERSFADEPVGRYGSFDDLEVATYVDEERTALMRVRALQAERMAESDLGDGQDWPSDTTIPRPGSDPR